MLFQPERMEMRAVIKDPERRRLLVGLLGIPAAYLALDREAASPITKTRLILNDDRMAFYEEQLEARWRMLYMGGPVHALMGMESWLGEVESFEGAARGTPWHKRSLAVLCMSYQLKGGAARDVLNYAEADKACQKALSIARELDNPELIASTLVREGVTLLRQQKPGEAAAHLQEALDIIRGRGYVTLRGNILQSLSQAYAKLQRPRECWSTVGLAESVLQQQTQVRERSQRVFNVASLSAAKGINALLLHDYDRAIALIDKGLSTCSPAMIPKRASMMIYKAEAYYGKKRIDDCTFIAEEAWDLASSIGAHAEMERVKRLHANLAQSRWGKERCVRRLGVMLGARD
jgi:tetratricopeptide (TPR) repeat protein